MSEDKSLRGDFAANRRLILLSFIAVFIGVVCSFVAVVLLKMISFFTNLFYYHQFSLEAHAPTNAVWGVASIFVPVVGGLIIGLMARYGSEKIRGHGIPEALEAILFGKSLMQPKVAILKPLSSAISIGSGGPFGAEGPIIMTGGAFGSILAQAFHLTAAERKTLLVAGAAAGMTAVFASPIAAVLLAVELLLFEWKPRSLVPVAIASMVAGGMRPLILGGGGPLFPVPFHEALGVQGLIGAAAVGLIGGFFATGVSKLLYKLEDAFTKLPIHWMWWPALGGLAVGIGGYFEPRVLGVGYDVIASLLKGDFTAVSVVGLVAIKALVWVIALASGTSGGVLAPLLIMGAGLGVIESSFLPGISAGIWPLVSMAAVLGGMMRSPFTAIIFAFELTHDMNALLPLMIASIIAYAVTVLIMKRSILTEKVARRGYDLFREYSVDPLERVRIEEVMSLNLNTQCSFSVSPKESCRVAADRMALAGVESLSVIAFDDPAKVLGVISLSDLLKARLRNIEEEQKHETFIRFG